MSIQEPEITVSETEDIYTSSDEYAQRFEGATGAWMLSVQEHIALEMVRCMRPITILDVGGGHGQLASPLCREGYLVTVLGSAPSCKKRIADLVDKDRCTFQEGNVIALPYENNSFDLVICFRLVTHCTQWTTLIHELCRVARRAVIVDYPAKKSINAIAPALFKAKKKIEKDTRVWRLFRHDEISEAFAASGFQTEARKAQFFLPMVLHRLLKIKCLSALMERICRGLGLTRMAGSPVIVNMTRANPPSES